MHPGLDVVAWGAVDHDFAGHVTWLGRLSMSSSDTSLGASSSMWFAIEHDFAGHVTWFGALLSMSSPDTSLRASSSMWFGASEHVFAVEYVFAGFGERALGRR